MGSVVFTYPKLAKSIGGFEIDAFVTEHYSHSNSVTDIPVEEGGNISDHVKPDPDEIQIQAFIGKAEFVVWDGPLPESSADVPPEDPKGRIKQAYFELLRLKEERQPVDVVTGLGTFTGMVITSFEIDREAANGNDLPFSMSFKKVRIVKSDIIKISASLAAAGNDQTASTVNAGQQATTQPKERENWMQGEWKYALNKRMATQDEYLEACQINGWVP